MATASSKTVYSVDLLKKLNVFVLRTIPGGPKYASLNKFLKAEHRNNLSMIVSRPKVPQYLQDKYGNSTYERKPRERVIRRGKRNYRKERLSRHRNNPDSGPESVNCEIRQILSRLSASNKEKLFKKFTDCKITNECGSVLVNNMYAFALDCNYIVDVYAEIILLLKSKNEYLYNQLIEKIRSTARDPLKFEGDDEEGKSKRWWIGNISLISELHRLSPSEFSSKEIYDLVKFLLSNIDKSSNHLEVACELLKKVLPNLIKGGVNVDYVVDKLDSICTDKNYESRLRFLAEEVVDIYDEHSE